MAANEREDAKALEHGIVIRTEGARIWVNVNESEVPCVLRGRLKKEHLRVTSLVVVGDRVGVDLQPDGTGAIASIEPRRTELSRPGFHGYTHVMAANVDQLVIVQAAKDPAFQRNLVERFLATAERGGMDAIVVVNKCDLVDEVEIRSWLEPLRASHVTTVLTSAEDGRGIEELRQLLNGKISVFAGKSGVGKSSLVNALYPDFMVRVSAVSGWSTKGRHTTTSSRLYAVDGGGYLADTPGIRELGLFAEDAEETVSAVFPEIEESAAGCKFRNCSHKHEPGCAVKAAVAAGEIDPDRYDHFLRLRKGG